MLRDYSTPKNGKAFEVIDFGRVSTDNQNEKSLGDQHEYDLDYLKQLMPKAQFKITTISGRAVVSTSIEKNLSNWANWLRLVDMTLLSLRT